MKVDLSIVELRSDLQFPHAMLKTMLPDVETALFFSQLYRLNATEVAQLIQVLFRSPVVDALTAEGGLHSHELQDYLVDIGFAPVIQAGDIIFGEVTPQGEILPEMWRNAQVEVADSIQKVADKLKDVIGKLPGKKGEMVFQSLAIMNSKRPIIGDYKAGIDYPTDAPNLVVFDVSGSMTEHTVHTIAGEVVALGQEADAHLAIVSNTCTHWLPGEYTEEAVLAAAEFGGTHYEELEPLFNDTEWGTVITIADYDSSPAARQVLSQCNGTIHTLLDISLVDIPTYLGEVLGQLAGEARPLMVASNNSLVYQGW